MILERAKELSRLTSELASKVQEVEALQEEIQKIVGVAPPNGRRVRAAEAAWQRTIEPTKKPRKKWVMTPARQTAYVKRKLKKNGEPRKPFVMTAARRAAMSENLRKAREARAAKRAAKKKAHRKRLRSR